MNPVTLRNIPPAVARGIRIRAQKKRISLNRAVLELLEEAVGTGSGSRRSMLHPDLDELFGVWSPAEAAAFQESLAAQRGIDPELWK
ncbi:MAG TPA: hypothetical protein VE981_15920 [Planctomycetota bacterium]|nr:hypothetical protein [Planctomycetota bacterium]